ncbi:MAG TPA: winged helix-turn-helix domain-containing protein [Gemmataceae bacterium]|nr:winged helix-turn-helix domain-containing protein [Gemmataceae bacterium]
MTTQTKTRRKPQQAAVCLDEAPTVTTSDPAPQDATDANVSQTNGKTAEVIQAAIEELVRKFGGNLRQWPEFPRVLAEAGLEPQDVTDERLAAASLHLHQRGEQFRDVVREANADPSSHFKVVLKGDPELDPTFHHSPVTQSEEENVMSEKKRTRKRTAATVEGDAQTKATTPKAGKTKKPKAEAEGKMSALDAAAKVLAEEGRPMTAKELIEAMATKRYWTSPGGKTPEATLSAALGTEINKKGDASRFAKPAPGKFALRTE